MGERLTHLDSQGNRHLDYFGLYLDLARESGIFRMPNNASTICLESPRPRLARWKTYLSRPHVWFAHHYRKRQMRRARAAGMRMPTASAWSDTLERGTRLGKKTGSESSSISLPALTRSIAIPRIPTRPSAAGPITRKTARELAVPRTAALREEVARRKVELVSFDAT